MRSQFLFCLVAIAWSASTAWAEEGDELTKEELLAAISIFAEAPLSEDGQTAAEIVAKYVHESKDIVVKINLGIFHWLAKKPDVKHKRTLLFAVIAGNLQSQLKSDPAEDQLHATMLFVFEIYHQLKADDKEFSIPMIEEQIEALNNGKLRDYIQEHQSPSEKPPGF